MIEQKHLNDWLASGVSEAIARLNIESKTDATEIAGLLGWKAWKNGEGYWITGVNPNTGKRTVEGGQFKPDKPPMDGFKADGRTPKVRKYLGRKAAAEPLFLQVPEEGYWEKVMSDPSIPIIITEGAKKAGFLLTCGFAAISIPGVTCGQKKGEIKASLKPFIKFGRKVALCFDADVRQNSNVQKALHNLASLFAAEGCTALVMEWDENQGKGIDDFGVKAGIDAAKKVVEDARPFPAWYEQFKTSSKRERLTFCQKATKDLYQNADQHWICVGGELYKWMGNYYKHQPLDDQIRRITQYCNEFKVEDEESISYPYAEPKYVNEILKWVRNLFSRSTEHINPSGLNCTNGVLKFKWVLGTPSWELIPHSPEHYYLYEPYVTYNPDADSTACDHLLKCLDPADREIFLRVVAASLDLATVRKYLGRVVRALFLLGKGGNGKDALRETVSMLYGRQGISSCSLSDYAAYDRGHKFPLYKARFSRVNWSSENHVDSSIDRIECLKAIISGETISYEAKGKNEEEVTANSILLFNCNEAPNFTGATYAIQSRYAILSFNKTFKSNANTAKGELEADPRFKYDDDFKKNEILPAFLNRLLQAFTALMQEGIDYSSTEAVTEQIKADNNHLYQFATDTGLVKDPDASIKVGDLWDRLYEWYTEQAIVSLDERGKNVWNDPVNPRDKYVKASSQIVARLIGLGYEIKTRKTREGVMIQGITFVDVPSPVEDAPKKNVTVEQQEITATTENSEIQNDAQFLPNGFTHFETPATQAFEQGEQVHNRFTTGSQGEAIASQNGHKSTTAVMEPLVTVDDPSAFPDRQFIRHLITGKWVDVTDMDLDDEDEDLELGADDELNE